jgi:hypothetical protein
MTAQDKDISAIEAIILRQFESLSWTAGAQADWEGFAADFSEHAALWPAARPAAPQTVPAFVARMRGIAQTSLTTFHEELLGSKIQIFGNVAVAIAAAEMTENATDTNCNVEMLLLVKSEGAWRIVCQAWDRADAQRPIPEEWVTK